MGVDYASIIERVTPEQIREARLKAIRLRAERQARERENEISVAIGFRPGRGGNKKFEHDVETKIEAVMDLIRLQRAFPQKLRKDIIRKIAANQRIGESTLRTWYARHWEEATERLKTEEGEA